MLPAFLLLLVDFSGIYTNAIQSHFLHHVQDTFLADVNAALRQSDADLFRSKSLFTIIKNLLDFTHELGLLILVFAPICTSEDVVIKSTAVNFQCLAQFMNAVCVLRPMIEHLQSC